MDYTKYLTIRQVAKKCGVSKPTILDRIVSGEMEHILIQGRYLIPPTEVSGFSEKKRGPKKIVVDR